MDVPGSGPESSDRDRDRDRDRDGDGDGDGDGETVEFGGLPFRDVRALRVLRARLGPHMPRGIAAKTAAVSLTLGLLVGFGVGHFTAHSAGKKPTLATGPAVVEPELVTTAISFTGNRCVVHLGKRLQLGIELINQSGSLVTLGRVGTIFPLGGLHAISSGVGACGALPGFLQPSTMPPHGTDWVFAILAVKVSCPEPLPVLFEVDYSVAGRMNSTMINGFPDLGSVPYGHCATAAAPGALPMRGDTLLAGGSAPPGTPRNPWPQAPRARNPSRVFRSSRLSIRRRAIRMAGRDQTATRARGYQQCSSTCSASTSQTEIRRRPKCSSRSWLR